ADLPATAQPENAAHELADVRRPAHTLPSTNSPHHSSLDGPCSMTQVLSGKSRVRENCTPGSVRAKAEWLSYSTIPRVHCRKFESLGLPNCFFTSEHSL